MRCDRCGREAIIELRYMGQLLCKDCFVKFYRKRLLRTIRAFNMFSKRDRVLVAVSGGKDSLSLLHALKKLGFNVAAISVDEGIRGFRKKTIKKVEEFCQEHSIDLNVYSFKDFFGITTDYIAKHTNQPPCSFCGVLRRYLINIKARQLGFDVVATAHTLDDEVQTLILNIIRGDIERIARGGPLVGVKEHERFVKRVKPMIKTPERENVVYALVNGIKFFDGACPYAKFALRNGVRKFLNEMEYSYPSVKYSTLKAYLALSKKLKESVKGDIGICEVCGEPSATKICNVCNILKQFGVKNF